MKAFLQQMKKKQILNILYKFDCMVFLHNTLQNKFLKKSFQNERFYVRAQILVHSLQGIKVKNLNTPPHQQNFCLLFCILFFSIAFTAEC